MWQSNDGLFKKLKTSGIIRFFSLLIVLTLSVPTPSVAGYTCSTKTYTSCNSGYYLSGGSCLSCTSGCTCAGGTAQPVCAETVNCSAGTFMWWWAGDGRTYCETCHTGYYCPGGTNVEGSGSVNTANSAGVVPIYTCPSGYRDGSGVTSQSGCYKTCSDYSVTGGTMVANSSKAYYSNDCSYTLSCSAGYYKSGDSCVLCESKYYCPGNNYRYECPATTTSKVHHYNGWNILVSPAGASDPTQCYLDSSIADSWTHEFQYPGFYRYGGGKCYYSGSTGMYNNCDKTKTFSECNAGYFIDNSAAMASGFSNRCTKCSAGSYTSQIGNTGYGNDGSYVYNTSCNLCPTGTYVDYAGATGCINCPSGYDDNPTTGQSSQSGCVISVSGGKYIGTANSSTQSSCSAGTYKATHTVSYGSTSSCSACSGRTKYSSAGASSCSTVSSGYYTTGCNSSSNNCTGQSQCTGATYCASGIQNNCPTNYTANTSAGKTAASSCAMSVSAKYYVKTAKDSSATSCGTGTYKAAHTVYYGSTSSCISCPSGYDDGAAASAQSGCVISVSGGKYIGTANSSTQSSCSAGTYKAAHTVTYGSTSSCSACTNKPSNSVYTGTSTSNSCPWSCNSGYGQTYDNQCAQMCTAGVTTIRTSNGIVVPLFTKKNTSPSIHIGYNNQVCYADLVPGKTTHAIHINYNGTVYHTAN